MNPEAARALVREHVRQNHEPEPGAVIEWCRRIRLLNVRARPRHEHRGTQKDDPGRLGALRIAVDLHARDLQIVERPPPHRDRAADLRAIQRQVQGTKRRHRPYARLTYREYAPADRKSGYPGRESGIRIHDQRDLPGRVRLDVDKRGIARNRLRAAGVGDRNDDGAT